MRHPKQYTMVEAGEILGVTAHTIRNYVRVGLIDVSRDDGWMKVGKEELDRVKREGVIAGRPGSRGAAAKTAKKSVKRTAAKTAAKKPAKRAAASRTAAKKPAKRTAAARTGAKKRAKK